jgi:hypothetical protein
VLFNQPEFIDSGGGMLRSRTGFEDRTRRLRHGSNASILRKTVSFALISSLLILPGPGFSLTDVRVFASTGIDLTRYPSRFLQPLFKSWFATRARARRQRETAADRASRVARIQVSPRRFVGYQGQSQTFSALPANINGQTIQGVKSVGSLQTQK